MIIYIASDHAGFETKSELIRMFPEIQWQDLGPNSTESVDYPDFADRVAKAVSDSREFGVLICGSGQGMCIRANRYPKVRAALCWNEEVAKLSREHNDANVLCLSGRLVSLVTNAAILKVFIQTPFAGGRHESRVRKLGVSPGQQEEKS